jgi:hypothetical protein
MPPIPGRLTTSAQIAAVRVGSRLGEVKEWKQGKIEVVLGDRYSTTHTVTTDAHVYGHLAVHESVNDATRQCGGYTVTAVNVGLRVASVDTPRHAQQIVVDLCRLCPAPFAMDDVDDMAAALPGWAKQWLKVCSQIRAWCQPDQYQRLAQLQGTN